MKVMKLFVVIALVAAFAGAAQAMTIAVVSDAMAPEVVGGDHNDDTLVAFLEGLGYTVLKDGMGGNFKEGAGSPWAAGNEAKLAVLKSADLVLVSRRTNSGAYDNDRLGWNELKSPLILTGGYLTRGETGGARWGWTTGGSSDAGDGTVTTIDLVGVSDFIPDPVVFDWTGSPAGKAPKSVYLPNSSADVIGGVVIAEYAGLPFLIDIAAGADLDAGNGTTGKYGILGARRAMLGHWGYDDGLTGTNGSDGLPSDWADYITDDYKDIFAQTIATMIPEPATFVILGLGGLLLRRRR
jgi:hypothetical protein